MNKRKVARWHKQFDLYEHAQKVYRREQWLWHKQVRWLTKEEAETLISEVSQLFGVPEPTAYLTLVDPERLNSWLGHFMVDKNGKHWLTVRAPKVPARRLTYYAVDNKCIKYTVYFYNIPKESYNSLVLLHELSHYLCFWWWGHSLHDTLFCSVHEALEGWWQRKKRKPGVKVAHRKKVLK